MTALAKVLISIEERMIPANIHFHNPNPEISALRDGRLQVVDKHMPLNGQYIGINSFGFGGTNVHCILKFDGEAERKVVRHPAANDLRLFTMSARTEEVICKSIFHGILLCEFLCINVLLLKH